MRNKIVHVLLCLMLCIAFIPSAAFADDETPSVPDGIWTDQAAGSFAGGTGTKADPYQIGTPEQLAKLAKDVNEGETYAGKYFRLTADLDLSEHVWIPIGLYRLIYPNDKISKPFEGNFDGSGKKISGMIVDQRGENDRYCGGLFGCIRKNSAEECGIKDLTIIDGKIYNNSDGKVLEMHNGILAGDVRTETEYYVDFEGIKISGGSIQVSGSRGKTDQRAAGGMLGYVVNVRASGCSVENIRISGVDNSGGFVGWDGGSVCRNCSATGELSGHWNLGGFVGYANDFTNDDNKEFDPYFENCLADVDITADDWIAGGFVGWAEFAHISSCVAKGNVTSTTSNADPRAGAFAGYLEICELEKCHAAGSATEVHPDYVAGGFAGHLYMEGNKLKDCSFDSTLNNDIKAVGGTEPKDYDGITGVPTQQVKANICRDYYDTHALNEVSGKDATCTEDGYETYWKCDACDSMYADKDGTAMITEPKVIKATGHELVKKDGKAASSTEDGHKEYWECSKCSKMFSDAKGQHEISEPEVIKATGASAVTGDSSNIVFYGLMALLAAVGAAGAGITVVTRKRRNDL